jgi:hypothetical protein
LMLSTSSTHGDFDAKGCGKVQTKECAELADSGRGSQAAANVVLAATAVAAIATVAIAVGFVNWHRDKRGAARNPFVITF